MAKLNREQFLEAIKARIGDDTSDLAMQFVEDMTDTFDLEFQHVDNKTIYQTRTQIQRGIDNLNQKGRAVVWDTETHNGINKYGQSETGVITEISFRVVDRDQNDEWNVSKEIQDENNNFFKLSGDAGTGKTLLLYDIAVELANHYKIII